MFLRMSIFERRFKREYILRTAARQQALHDQRASRIAEEKQKKIERQKAINAFREDREDILDKTKRKLATEANRLKAGQNAVEK